MKIDKESNAGMTLIVKTITRLTVGLILLYGIYVVFNGHLSPGGGFAGGVIIALSFIHLMLAFGENVAIGKMNFRRARRLVSLGALLFLFVALLGFIGGNFFSNFLLRIRESCHLFNEGSIPFYEVAISLIVGGGLFVIFVALVFLHRIDKDL